MSIVALAFLLTASTAPAPILLDARCDEPAWQNATSQDLGAGVALRAMADAENIYLCLTLPPESQGTLDLYIATPDGAQTNLHVSAQTGERVRGANGWGDWEGFNNHTDWYGPPVPFQGMSRNAEGQLRPDFAYVSSRELQLRRSRFGGDEWRYMIEVRRLTTGNLDTAFPAGANVDDVSTWSTLSLPAISRQP
jgi:hypothetical protein